MAQTKYDKNDLTNLVAVDYANGYTYLGMLNNFSRAEKFVVRDAVLSKVLMVKTKNLKESGESYRTTAIKKYKESTDGSLESSVTLSSGVLHDLEAHSF